MRILLIKILFLIICIVPYINSISLSTGDMAIMLLSLCLMLVPEAIRPFAIHNNQEKLYKRIMNIVLFIFSLIIFYEPAYTFLIPLMIFNVVTDKLYIGGAFQIIALIYGAHDIKNINLLIPFAIIILGYVVCKLIEENEIYHNDLIKSRDYSKEYEMLLEEKNKSLMENQDNKVYAATLSERNRIAREIHDNVGHMLTRSILQIGAIKIINKDNKLDKPLEDLHETLNTAMTNIRSSVHDLHDESVDLKSAIEDILNSVTEFETEFDYDMEDQVPRQIKYAFISITKEAVNNAIKHSNGDKITVIMREHPGFYQLSISDNGNKANVNYNSGIGISNMEERAKQIGGNIKVSTHNGFTVLLTVMRGKFENK